MGNCLVMEEKVIKIMRNDGKVVEYKGPMKVHHILTQFSSHGHGHYSLFDSLSNTCHLHPQAKLLCGRLYYLLPKEKTTIEKIKKKVSFANPEVQEEEERSKEDDNTKEKKSVGVVRVKMVVSKQELEKMLQGGSLHELVYKSLSEQHLSHDDHDHDHAVDECHRGWRPLLDSIPESN